MLQEKRTGSARGEMLQGLGEKGTLRLLGKLTGQACLAPNLRRLRPQAQLVFEGDCRADELHCCTPSQFTMRGDTF